MSGSKLLRVTQINASYFDREIENILTGQFASLLSNLPPGFLSRVQPEVNASIKLLILYFSIIQCNRTFGQKLFSLRYAQINGLKKCLYLLMNFYEYAEQRLAPSNPAVDMLFSLVNSLVVLARFANTSLFLLQGKYPNLNERFLGLKQEYVENSAQRFYDGKYMTRELLWNGLIEILVYVLPLVNYHKVVRLVKNLNPFQKKAFVPFCDNPAIFKSTLCAHCRMSPILPHHMGCAHIFCYSCLKGNLVADASYECPICGKVSENGLCKKVYCVRF